MNKLTFAIGAALIFATACATPPVKTDAGPGATVKSEAAFKRPALTELKYKPINTEIPTTKRAVLSNGITVLMFSDRELPLFTVNAMIKTGAIWEPADKVGLAELTGSVMRSGGTKTRKPDELDETLEFIAASVETSIGNESGGASLSVLSKDTDLGLDIFADVLRNPAFDTARFELAKARTIEGIRRQNDDLNKAAYRELIKLVYGDSPYGRYPTIESVTSVTRKDVIEFHKKYFVPQNVLLGVTGDFDENEIINKLEKVFAGWSGPDPVFPEVKPVEEIFEGGVYHIQKDAPQSVIRAGSLAGKRTDPDYHAVRIMGEILGSGGFKSRLVRLVRVDKGLAYSVWAYTMAGRWELGTFAAGAETKTASTAEVIRLIKSEITRIRNEPVSKAELDDAVKAMVNRFIFIFDKPSKIMSERMTVEYYGMPADYLESYRDKVEAVTIEDVQRAAQKRLNPDSMKIVVIGDNKNFDAPLSEFGDVRELKLDN